MYRNLQETKIAVIGLGYVGLPLAQLLMGGGEINIPTFGSKMDVVSLGT